jgi:hypothetical protein
MPRIFIRRRGFIFLQSSEAPLFFLEAAFVVFFFREHRIIYPL